MNLFLDSRTELKREVGKGIKMERSVQGARAFFLMYVASIRFHHLLIQSKSQVNLQFSTESQLSIDYC